MGKMIFVNLPVTDVAAATAFYAALGFEQNYSFSNAQATSMMWSDAITVMLLHRDFYATFTDKEIIDARRQSGVLLCLSFDDRAAVDAFTKTALGAGGRELHGAEDHGVHVQPGGGGSRRSRLASDAHGSGRVRGGERGCGGLSDDRRASDPDRHRRLCDDGAGDPGPGRCRRLCLNPGLVGRTHEPVRGCATLGCETL